MEETLDFCSRVLGPGAAAEAAARAALAGEAFGRVEQFAEASRACRAQAPEPLTGLEPGGAGERLEAAVARELTVATARLPERQREALALRESARLSYAELGQVMGIGAAAAGPLLARARLRLREELRGPRGSPPTACAERDRALRALAHRQDGEQLAPQDGEWLAGHLGACAGCAHSHAAMLEASLSYRAWSLESVSVVTQAVVDPVEVRPSEPEPDRSQVEVDPESERSEVEVESEPEERARPPLWSRFRAALVADARR